MTSKSGMLITPSKEENSNCVKDKSWLKINSHGHITITQTCLWNRWIYCGSRSFCCEPTACVSDVRGYVRTTGCRLGSGAFPGQTSDPETSARQEDHRSSHCHLQRMTSVYVDQKQVKETRPHIIILGGSDSMLMLNQWYKAHIPWVYGGVCLNDHQKLI